MACINIRDSEYRGRPATARSRLGPACLPLHLAAGPLFLLLVILPPGGTRQCEHLPAPRNRPASTPDCSLFRHRHHCLEHMLRRQERKTVFRRAWIWALNPRFSSGLFRFRGSFGRRAICNAANAAVRAALVDAGAPSIPTMRPPVRVDHGRRLALSSDPRSPALAVPGQHSCATGLTRRCRLSRRPAPSSSPD